MLNDNWINHHQKGFEFQSVLTLHNNKKGQAKNLTENCGKTEPRLADFRMGQTTGLPIVLKF